jgi:hypothetical protein
MVGTGSAEFFNNPVHTGLDYCNTEQPNALPQQPRRGWTIVVLSIPMHLQNNLEEVGQL